MTPHYQPLPQVALVPPGILFTALLRLSQLISYHSCLRIPRHSTNDWPEKTVRMVWYWPEYPQFFVPACLIVSSSILAQKINESHHPWGSIRPFLDGFAMLGEEYDRLSCNVELHHAAGRRPWPAAAQSRSWCAMMTLSYWCLAGNEGMIHNNYQ